MRNNTIIRQLSALLLGLALALITLAGTITYYIPDAQGSPIAATDAQGNILWRKHYEPYGKEANGVADDVGYTGHEYDQETGLTYMQARYYDPVVGRFYSIDPVGFDPNQPMTFNRYSYANNNPYKYVDPDGRDTFKVNRDLRVWGDVIDGAHARSRSDPLTHTFVVTTNNDSSVEHTYSWGNDANTHGWSKDQKIDIETAKEALQGGLAEKVGDSSLDPFVDSEKWPHLFEQRRPVDKWISARHFYDAALAVGSALK